MLETNTHTKVGADEDAKAVLYKYGSIYDMIQKANDKNAGRAPPRNPPK